MDDIYQIINLYLDGEATDEQVDALRAWLKEDEAHCREMYVRVLLHCQVRDQVHSDDLIEVLGDVDHDSYELVDLTEAGDAETPATHSPVVPPAGDQASRERDEFHFGALTVRRVEREAAPSKPWFWRMAAAVLLAALLSLWFIGPNNTNQDVPIVAKLVNAVEAEWDENTGDLEIEQALHPGAFRLKKGYAQLLLSNGASVIVEGPSDFELIDGERLRLTHGRLSASLRQGADRLEVLSPNARIVDLGTVFGIDVRVDGVTEVEVLEGKVAMEPTVAPQGQTPEPLVLQTGSLARAANNQQVERLPNAPWRTQRFYASWPELLSRPIVTGDAELLRHIPGSVEPGSLEADRKVLVIQERAGFVTDQPIPVDAARPGVYTGPDVGGNNDVLPTGSKVSSYLLHYDRLGESHGQEVVAMSIRFATPIVAVIGQSQRINDTDRSLGSPDIAYMRKNNRGMETMKKAEVGYFDLFEISEDRMKLTVKLRTTRGIDQLRVLVASDE